MMPEKLMPCRRCGWKAKLETWSSGGFMCMAKCTNPDCFHPEDYAKGRNLNKVISAWNNGMEDFDDE